MSESDEAKPVGQEQGDGEVVLDLNFAPSWARVSPEAQVQRYQNDRYSGDGDSDSRHSGREGGRDRRPRRDFDSRDRRRPERRERGADDRGPRPSSQPGGMMSRPESRGAVADLRGPRPEGAPRFERDERHDSRAPRQEAPALPLEIRVLPEQKALGAVIRRIQTSHRAYPLRDIAWLFLDNPASCLVRVEPLKEQPLPLFQCKVCGLPALSEEDIRAHLVNRHMDDFFEVEEVTCEPPSGAFVCVARCSLSGELLGPPNHHSFNTRVQEMLRTRFPELSEEAYRARIETVRETEVIERWRQQCTKKKVYRRKGVTETVAEDVPGEAAAESEPPPKAPAMEREVAELVFLREILPAQVASVRHLICTAAVAVQTPSRPLFYALREMLNRERRFPASLFFALRGAFRHRNLHLFRVNDPRGADFVMLKAPSVLDTAHAVQALRDVLTYVNEHPACTRAELVTELAGADEGKVKETLVQLAWLVEKGHVIEYYNDVLSAPLDYPAFRFLPGEKQAGGAAAPAARRPAAPAPAAAQAAAPEVAPAAPAEPAADGAACEAVTSAAPAEPVADGAACAAEAAPAEAAVTADA